jgi:hypothetical protein
MRRRYRQVAYRSVRAGWRLWGTFWDDQQFAGVKLALLAVLLLLAALVH